MPIAANRSIEKVDNNRQAFKAKVAIRRNVLAAIGAGRAVVFDGFAGSGKMHDAVWREAASYTGCDLKHVRDGRLMFAADNRRVLRAIELAPFNVFDLDAYGSPWHQAIIVADRRPVRAGELLGLVLTEGGGLFYKQNGIPTAVTELTGIRPGLVGAGRKQDAIIDRAVAGLARRMSCDIVRRWQAEGRTGAAMRYIGLVLRGR